MHPKSPKWLDDVADAAAFIVQQTMGKTLTDDKEDRALRSVVERNVEIAGVTAGPFAFLAARQGGAAVEAAADDDRCRRRCLRRCRRRGLGNCRDRCCDD